jgi:hypothetical protein
MDSTARRLDGRTLPFRRTLPGFRSPRAVAQTAALLAVMALAVGIIGVGIWGGWPALREISTWPVWGLVMMLTVLQAL